MQKLGPGIFIGGVLLLTAVLLTFFVGVPIIIDNKVKEETQLVKDGSTFEKWRDVPIPVYIKFNIFNITNPDEVEAGGTANVHEVGPFVYKEIRQKEILEINEDEDTITYKEYIHYVFTPEDSVASEDTEFTILNAPLIIVSTILAKTLYGFANIPIDILMGIQNETFTRRGVSVRDMIFDGFDATNFMLWVSLSPGGPPAEFEGGKFAFYRGKNGTSDGIYKIKSGVKDHTQFGTIVEFENSTELKFWTDPSLPSYAEQYCNKINGTDGSIFPPFFDKDRVMRMLVMDICRSVFLTYEKEIDFEGIKGYRFTVPDTMLADPKDNEDNRCFCVDPGGMLHDGCVGGVIRLFPCKSNAPIGTSNPHFLGAPHLLSEVTGLTPQKELHETTIDVEPRSGQLLHAVKRIQITMELQPLSLIGAFRHLPAPSRMIPLFWAEETAWLDEKEVDELKDKLVKPLKLLKIVQWVLIGVSGAVVLGGAGLTYFRFGK